MFNETKKIMHTDARCSAMCVRISSLRAHSEAVWIETEKKISVEAAQEALRNAPGVTLVDDPKKVGAKANADASKETMEGLPYPMPLYTAGKDDVYVGRVREDLANDNGITATYAIDAIADAVQKVSDQRSALGAIQNRLEHTIKNLDNVVENTTAAESQIRDTDMASEMVKYSNNNILQQAGQSMLAQANQSNQGVLSLLG